MKKLLVMIFLIGGVAALLSRTLAPVNSEDTTRTIVQIPSGASLTEIARTLKENGLIRSEFVFTTLARLKNLATTMKAGSFSLTQSMNLGEILSALSGANTSEAIVTIPEGFSVKDIDALLTERNIIDPGAIIACAKHCDFSAYKFLPTAKGLAERGGRIEGYLYPDTYFIVETEFDPAQFLGRLLRTFEARVVRDLAADLKASKRSLHEIVTMASLIEEETRTEEERPIVSGILWKRFDADMGLGVDATVRYVLGKPEGNLTTADLNINSPYNLRKFKGLPPGPIASPGLGSIKAALHPQETEYWYYLHGTDGKIRYAGTNEEHNVNKYKYLK